jgi:hypothetical protein
VREDRGREVGRLLAGLATDLDLGQAAWSDHPPSAPPRSSPRGPVSGGSASSPELSRLARWNC